MRAKPKDSGYIVIATAAAATPHRYKLATSNETGEVLWHQKTVADQPGEPGEMLTKTWEFWGGGMGETYDVGLGGYRDCWNIDISNPFSIRPLPVPTLVTLTGNASPVTFWFEASDASANKYLYCLAGRYGYKIKLSTMALVETKDFGAAASAGHPAEWNSIWCVPLGDSVDFARLTVCAVAPATDTWATATGLKALHFCVFENFLARAYASRTVEKCSETDPTVAGNWGGTYYVSRPGDVVTDLVACGNEVMVCTQRNAFLFDGTSVARPILEDSAASTNNGRGALRWRDRVFLPYGDLSRYMDGGAIPIGPDSLPYYVLPTIDITDQMPIRLTHYALASYKNRVYAAASDMADGVNTNYWLLVGRPQVGGGMHWDGFHIGNGVLTSVYVDSSNHLWVNSANNVRYFTLGLDGTPQGYAGDGTGGMDFAATDLGTPALKRLDSVELQIAPSTLPANFAFEIYVERDNEAAEQVGAAITTTTNGIATRYWTPGTKDTARRVRVMPSYDSSAAQSVLIEITRVTLRAEPLPADADRIEATVILDGEPNTELARLKARIGVGASMVSDPDKIVLQSPIYPTIYEVEATEIAVKPGEKPIKAAIVRMRRGDVA